MVHPFRLFRSFQLYSQQQRPRQCQQGKDPKHVPDIPDLQHRNRDGIGKDRPGRHLQRRIQAQRRSAPP